MNYLDAHNHLHDERLAPHRADIFAEMRRLGVTRAVVNGTRESDWNAVTALGFGTPSYGLHPWWVKERSAIWDQRLRDILAAAPDAAIGEIGLDRWIEGHDLADQTEVFLAHLRIAAEMKRPVTIHCIQAWGALWDALRTVELPRGFLIHAYGGPSEMTAGFIERGSYFSFSPYFLHERKAMQREIFRDLPADRILVETDAPDLRPPNDCNPRPLAALDGSPINHPGNIDVAYAKLAEIRGLHVEELAEIVAVNFTRLFGG